MTTENLLEEKFLRAEIKRETPTEKFARIITAIWRLQARRKAHRYAGNWKAAANCQTRIRKACKELAAC